MTDSRTFMKPDRTGRGFSRQLFFDRYGQACSLQDSSLATERAVWLGVDFDVDGRESARMHLTQDMAKEIVENLQRFIATGSITEKPNGPEPASVFATLRKANVARQRAWCPDQIPDLSFRGNELAGETGEVCNVIKKLERERLGWRGSRDTVEHLAEELADVVICADLVAIAAGIDIDDAIEAKFNSTSAKVGLPHRLERASPPLKQKAVGPSQDLDETSLSAAVDAREEFGTVRAGVETFLKNAFPVTDESGQSAGFQAGSPIKTGGR